MSPRADSWATLPLDALEQIDRLCARFEAAWSSGSAPALTDYLAEAPTVGREVLLRELVSLDLEYRGRRGEATSFEHYAGLLPQDVELLRSAWTEVAAVDSSPTRGGDSPAAGRGSSFGSAAARPRGVHRFGDYELLRELGRGGMGVVYEARQLSLGRLVALKMIKDSAFVTADQVLRFQNEAKVVATLDHPHIVPILDVGEFEGQHCFSMKLIAGSSLARRLDVYAADPSAAAALVILVAEAVHHAHQRGILHRDLKPANILVDEQGQPHVTDFGLAKRIDEDNELTRTGAVVGTPSYMAPEQGLGACGSTTTATDVYGLGAILYALLTGRAPFADDTPLQTLEQLRDRAPDPPSQHNPQVPRDLEIICLKCLEKDPKWRYASAQAMAEDLRHWQAGKPIAARPVSTATRAWMWCRRKPMLASLAAALLVALVGGFVGVVTQWRRAEAGLTLVKSTNANLVRARDELQQNLYYAEMYLAQQAAESAEGTGRAKELLAHWFPEVTGIDRRGWEWYYLYGLGWRDHLTLETIAHGPIQHMSWSPDGRHLVAGDDYGNLTLWEPNTGREIRSWKGHARRVNGLCWSVDGRRLISADPDGTIKTWDAESRHVPEMSTLHLSPLPSRDVWVMSWSPDGRRLVSTSEDGNIPLWDAGTGHATVILRGDIRPLNAACWSPDGRRLASASSDGMIRLWDAGKGEAIATFREPAEGVVSMSWSPDGRRLATGGRDQTVRLWDIDTTRSIATLRGHTDLVFTVAWRPDGHQLASVSRDQTVKLWNPDSGTEIATLRGHEAEVISAAWSPNGHQLASGDLNGTVRLWEADVGRVKLRGHVELRGHADAVYAVSWSRDDHRLASASLDHSIKVWDAETGREVASLRGHTNWVEAVSWSPDDRRLASGSHDGTIKLWDAEIWRETASLDGQAEPVLAVSWSPDGRRLAGAYLKGSIRIWDADAVRENLRLAGHDREVWSVSWSPDGRRLASAGRDGSIKVWDAQTGAEVASLRDHNWEVKSVGWSPDGRRLASASIDGTIKLWDVGTRAMLTTLRGHNGWIMGVSWSPDGRRLASAGWDHTVRIWDPDTWRETTVLKEHTDRVNAVTWSRDGHRLASGGWDKMVRIWDARSGYARERPR